MVWMPGLGGGDRSVAFFEREARRRCRPKPYIGITDFENAEQVIAMANVLRIAQKKFQPAILRKLMVGVMISYKTLHGVPSKWANAWPAKETLSEIFIEHEDVFNTIHYADYDAQTSVYDLFAAIDFCGMFLHAIQLDMIWPDVEMVMAVKEKYPDLSIVLQLNTKALEQAHNDPEEVVCSLASYCGTIDVALLDKRMGHGKWMDAIALLPFMQAIASSHLGINIAAAGGLGPNSMHLIHPLILEYPDLSVDAQGQLRPSMSALDPIDWYLAENYIIAAVKKISGK